MKQPSPEYTGVHQLDIDPTALRLLDEIITDFPDSLRVGDETAALDWLEAAGRNRSNDLHDADAHVFGALHAMKAGDRDYGSVVVRTGTVDHRMPPTPADYLKPEENVLYDLDLRRGILLGAVGLYGYGFTTQQGAVIHNNMLLAASAAGKNNNASTPGRLGFHTEDSFFCRDDAGGISPDVLVLSFFRNQEGVSTPVSVVDPALLDDDCSDILRQARFATPTSNAHTTSAPVTERLPILYGEDDWVRFNVPLMTGEAGQALHDEEELAAMLTLAQHLDERAAADLTMASGDILFINNRTTLHAKGEQSRFVAAGENRWQRRLVTVTDGERLEPYCVVSNNRMVDPQNYLASL